MNKSLIAEILIAVSLTNLLFIRAWKRLIYPAAESYHLKLEPNSIDCIAVILTVILTATIFLFGFWSARYFGAEKSLIIVKLLFLLIIALALNGIRQQIYEIFPNSFNYLNLAFLAVILVIGVFSWLNWQNYFFEAAKLFCLILAPFFLITFTLAIWKICMIEPTETSIKTQLSTIQSKEKSTFKNRVIWIIFDELDYSVPFEKGVVSLPEFEKLKQTSFFATNAIPPAYTTRDATASLITGKKVESSEAISRNDLRLKFADGETKFSETPNIFRQIKSLNGETALVGWVQPYCRVIGTDLSVCRWFSFDTINDVVPSTLGRSMIRNWQNLLISVPFGSRFNDLLEAKITENIEDKGYLNRHSEMMEATHEITTNPKIDLAFIHLPFPHPPNYYNAKKGNFDKFLSKKTSRENSYLDNLILTDNVLGEIRKTLEANQLWDDSTIIILSDHQWRLNVYQNELSEKERQITNGKEDVRVPFFLKLKGQKDSSVYEKPFNTVVTADLVLAIMKGEVISIEDVKTWLEKNSNR